MKCRSCGREIGFVEPDGGYVDEDGRYFCKTYPKDPHAPFAHEPDYSSDAASSKE